MRNVTCFLTTLALVSALACPAHAASSPLASAMHALSTAVAHGQLDDILAARGTLAVLAADAPDSPHHQYALALADWRAVPMFDSSRTAQARTLCKEGIAACDRALGSDPRFADALAMRAALQGLAMRFAPGTGMSLGQEILEQNTRARAMAPGNPRVQLLVAISVMHQPEFVGGGPKPARELFERAIALYDAAGDHDASDIAWGREDAYLWSGLCLAALGDWTGARARYQQVLAVAPGHAWTKQVLLPGAEKHVATGSAH
jgi:tetratricopeptide (TPR) repeat protein